MFIFSTMRAVLRTAFPFQNVHPRHPKPSQKVKLRQFTLHVSQGAQPSSMGQKGLVSNEPEVGRICEEPRSDNVDGCSQGS